MQDNDWADKVAEAQKLFKAQNCAESWKIYLELSKQPGKSLMKLDEYFTY